MSQATTRTRSDLADEVFANLPYGIVVVEGDGSVTELNPVAARMLFGDRPPPSPLSCSDLFECGAPGAPCEHGCLIELSASGEGPSPEFRVDVDTGGDVSAVWVTVSPLEGGSRSVLHLRPGHANDRRKRSDPEWSRTPRIRLRALGRTAIDGIAGAGADSRWLGQRPGQLLKYLVSQRDRVAHPEQIAEALWPGSRRGLGNVRFTVHSLRKRLEPDLDGNGSSLVVAVAGGYALDRRRLEIDADRLEASVHAGLAEFTQGEEGSAERHLREAVDLYRGDLFAEERYTEWVQRERERLRGLYARALRVLSELYEERGELDAAIQHLERLVEVEPYDSDSVRALLRALLKHGRRTRAVHHYDSFRNRLHRAFGERPGFDLAAVATALAVNGDGNA